MSILIVGEKPSVSRAISAVVGASSAHKGYTEGNGYIVSWCVGHLVGLKFPNDYGNGWEQKWSFSQLPMIPDSWLFHVTDSTKAQYDLLKNLMNKDEVTEIICATDADREGECIFRYVYNMARCRKPVKRLWVSSLEESAIRKALSIMKPMSAYQTASSLVLLVIFIGTAAQFVLKLNEDAGVAVMLCTVAIHHRFKKISLSFFTIVPFLFFAVAEGSDLAVRVHCEF